jgi:hypothetical protein
MGAYRYQVRATAAAGRKQPPLRALALATDDLFIFYYAGYGFHGAGGNGLGA